ncbi:MAG: DUF72 domain-containing protein [Desulfobaccales bacterium]
MVIKVGCCGFPVRRSIYAGQLSVVEVQQTFYEPPRVATARCWRTEMPPDFEFTLKAWQLITHESHSPTYRRLKTVLSPEERSQAGGFKPTKVVRRAWEATREIAWTLNAQVILFQCPATFAPTPINIDNLRRFFQELDRELFLLAWEPRGSWPLEEVERLCRELDLIPAADPLTTPTVPWPRAYFRLHGKTGYRYTYTESDLLELQTFLTGRQEVYVLFNNISMWENARQFLRIISA